MKPSGRFSPTSTGPAGFGALIARELVLDTGCAKDFGGAGGRLNGLAIGSLAISAIICGVHGLLPSLIVAARLYRVVADLARRARRATAVDVRHPRIHRHPQREIRPDGCGFARDVDAATASCAARCARDAIRHADGGANGDLRPNPASGAAKSVIDERNSGS